MIMIVGGRRIDAHNATVRRFPLRNLGMVRERLRVALDQCSPTVMISSAAAGADLLALEEARRRGIRRRVFLPFSPERFRQTSVSDVPGDWGPMFDEICAHLQGSQDLVVMAENRGRKPNDSAYLTTILTMLDDAVSLSGHSRESEQQPHSTTHDIIALAIWDGVSRGANDMTAHFISEAHARGIQVIEVSTL